MSYKLLLYYLPSLHHFQVFLIVYNNSREKKTFSNVISCLTGKTEGEKSNSHSLLLIKLNCLECTDITNECSNILTNPSL